MRGCFHQAQALASVTQKRRSGLRSLGLVDIEPDVPFVGAAKEYLFDCPQVNPAETAILLFQSRDVSHSRNILQINGRQVYGGLPVSPSRAAIAVAPV
jgi:hypothetical protein